MLLDASGLKFAQILFNDIQAVGDLREYEGITNSPLLTCLCPLYSSLASPGRQSSGAHWVVFLIMLVLSALHIDHYLTEVLRVRGQGYEIQVT